VALTADSDNVRWTQISGFVKEAYRAEPARV
jgi:hypothetical protein